MINLRTLILRHFYDLTIFDKIMIWDLNNIDDSVVFELSNKKLKIDHITICTTLISGKLMDRYVDSWQTYSYDDGTRILSIDLEPVDRVIEESIGELRT